MALTRRAFTLGAVATGAATAAGLTIAPQTASAATYTAYVMTYFTESPNFVGADYGLHVAVSRDGLNWTPLNQNNPVVTPTAGQLGLRDPFVFRKQDGTFVVIATDLRGTDFGTYSQYLHVWDSTNLTSFTGYRRLRMHTYNAHTWAPTVFWDAGRGQYGIVYSCNTSSGDMFLVNYTSDFQSVGSPQATSCATADTPSGSNRTPARRRSGPTRRSTAPPASATPPGRRSAPTTSPTGTCGTPDTCCASTR